MLVKERYLELVNGTYYARLSIPADVRLFLGHGVAFRLSLLTRDLDVARAKRDVLIAGWQADIVTARMELARPRVIEAQPAAGMRPATVTLRPTPNRVNRDQALAALRRWRIARAADLRDDYFSGIRPLGFRLMKAPNVDACTIEALAAIGLTIDSHHAVVAHLRERMKEELTILHAAERAFSAGHLDWTPEALAPAGAAKLSQPLTAQQSRVPRLVEFLDRWILSKVVEPGEQTDARYVVRRLTEFLGRDPYLDEVTTADLVSFCTALTKLPKSQKPAVRALDLHALVDRYGLDPTVAKITSVTVWKLMCLLGRIFKFAMTIEVIPRTPVPGAIPKKGEFNAREAWSRRDVADIFSRPMFTGFDGQDRGQRDVPGHRIVRDARFWLPILCLYHGTRMEEFGAALACEVTEDEATGIWHLDLRSRKLDGTRSVKNRESQRRVPIHAKCVSMGFIDYVRAQQVKADDAFLFPELPHGNKSGVSSTHWYSSRWRAWVRQNAKGVEGATFDRPTKVFHSFRHTWKQRARERDVAIPEQYSDALVGHASVSQGRQYGEFPLEDLQAYMDRVSHPTFPL